MGILQAAYKTYESYSVKSGVREEGKEALIPVSHIVQKASIEIEIDTEGNFKGAKSLGKGENTIFPATPESAGRTSKAVAHPLSDQLIYLAEYSGEKFESYISQLAAWAESEFSNPKVRAVLAYAKGGTILEDLFSSGLIELEESGTPTKKHEKDLVRWRVIPAPEGENSACWEDSGLFENYVQFFASNQGKIERDMCMISGEADIFCAVHPKGVLPASYGAKIISSEDKLGFKYSGRFKTAEQAYNVGYISSQKAHNALRWVVVNNGVFIGGRTFICWNPEGNPVPSKEVFFGLKSEKQAEFTDYKRALLLTLGGYRDNLKDTDDVVIAALDAATTGRLSVTYYNELKASDFLNRIEKWYTECIYNSRFFGVQSPPIRQIAECAFGTLRGEIIEADEKVLKEHVQQLLHCIIDCSAIPEDIVRALVTKAGNVQIYKEKNREKMLATACAVIKKHRKDKFKEEWDLALDTSNTNRSYLFGRLLAIAEQAERSTYRKEEGREANAIKLQAVFAQRPLYAWRLIEEKLLPYFAQHSPGLRAYYKNMIGEVTGMLPGMDDPELGKRLDDVYLLGYYHQRTALLTKKNDMEDNENESE